MVLVFRRANANTTRFDGNDSAPAQERFVSFDRRSARRPLPARCVLHEADECPMRLTPDERRVTEILGTGDKHTTFELSASQKLFTTGIGRPIPGTHDVMPPPAARSTRALIQTQLSRSSF